MLTDRDIVVRVVAEGRDPAATAAADAATSDVVAVEADAPAAEALRLMADGQVGRLMVVDGGRLVGIISRRDVAADLPAEAVGEATQAVTEG